MSKIKIKYLDGKEYNLGGDKLLEDVSFSTNDVMINYIDKYANFRRMGIPGQVLYVSQRVGNKNTIFHNPAHRISIDILSAKQRAKKNRKVSPNIPPKYTCNGYVLGSAGTNNSTVEQKFDILGSVVIQNLGVVDLVLEDHYDYVTIAPYGMEVKHTPKVYPVDHSDNTKPEEPPFPYKETGSLVQHLCDTIDDLQGKIVLLQKELTQLKGK